ncbi:MAG: hydroxyacid dehydrogenase, partial [Alphaproteobacteria bacterium]|nr:hydroxyacid dehydrogenase [Alphaproteobacteria bacterium]
YYSVLAYGRENRELVGRLFDVTELADPRADTDAVLANAEVLFAPLGFAVDRARLAKAPRLKAVVSNTTGIPHIDAVEANRRGIAICALHDEQAFLDTITPTAEHAIGLMLAAWRRIPAAHAAACAGKWDRNPWGAPRMFSRMRLGLVGHGRLGRKVRRIAEAMGMEVAHYDPHVAGGVASLLDLARRSDVLSLHAVANEETKGLVSRAVLETLPRGAMVVNTARGELLDLDALLDLLESGHLAAAALDTIDGEYDPEFSRTFAESRVARYARGHDNLVLTPHIGGSTLDAWSETQRFVILKAARALGLAVPS